MIKKFNDFSESLLESLLNESILYFSPDFRNKLKMMKNKTTSLVINNITNDLLNLEGENLDSDVTFIDLSKDEGFLHFMPMAKAIDKIHTKFPTTKGVDGLDVQVDTYTNDLLYDREMDGWNIGIYKGTNSIKVGKFIQKVMPGKYNDKQIEEFVNNLKSIQSNNQEKISLVKGEDIKYWYNKDNYLSQSGSLGNSCMADKDFFDIYVKNPDVCRLLIMTIGDKLIGRALVWKINSCEYATLPIDGDDLNFEYYIDRVYTSKDYQINIIKDYARNQRWALRSSNGYSSGQGIEYKGKEIEVKMSVKINSKIKYKSYPYMDTFVRYDYVTGLLWNDDRKDRNTRGHILRSTQGDYLEGYPRGYIRRFGDYFGLNLPPFGE